jgi:hypothetical protein
LTIKWFYGNSCPKRISIKSISDYNFIQFWNLNQNCEYVSNSQKSVKSLFDLEKQKNFDFTEDGKIGVYMQKKVSEYGGYSLGTTLEFYVVQKQTDSEATLINIFNCGTGYTYYTPSIENSVYINWQSDFIPKIAMGNSTSGYTVFVQNRLSFKFY